MQVSTYEKQLSKSITLPKGQLTKKKTPSLTSSQCKRHLNGKLSIRYLPSGFKPKFLQHSQDREFDDLFTSCGQSNARDIGNFKQGYRKQQKIQTNVGATKPGGQSLMDLDKTFLEYSGNQMRIKNRRQPHATVESKKKKLQTEEDILSNHHHDPDRMLSKIWYIVLWRKLKKQAKKIADSKADADSSSYKSITFDSCGTRGPSDSTGNNFEKLYVSNENLAFQSSKGVTVNYESQKRKKYDKVELPVQASMILESNILYTLPRIPDVSSYASIQNQNTGNEENEDTHVEEKDNVDQEKKAEEIPEDASGKECQGDDVHGTSVRKCMSSKIWYKYLWMKLKRQARKVANPNADADSSSHKSMSDEKQMIFHKSPKKSNKTHALERLSNSIRQNKLEEIIVSDENLILSSSEGVKIVSREKVSYSKKVPATDVLSHLSSQKKDSFPDFTAQVDITTTSFLERTEEKQLELKNSAVDKRTFDSYGTRRPSDSTGNNFEKFFASDENFAFRSSKGVEVNYENQKRDKYDKVELPVQASMILESNVWYTHPRIPDASIPNQDRDATRLTPEETLSSISDDCDIDATSLTHEVTLSTLSDDWDIDNEENEDVLVRENDNVVLQEKYSLAHLRLLVGIITASEKTEKKPVENTFAYVRLCPDIALSDKTGEKSIEDIDATSLTPEVTLSTVSIDWINVLSVVMELINISDPEDRGNEENEDALVHKNYNVVLQKMYKNAKAGLRYKHELTVIKIYRNIIKNETCRVMISIDMVVSKANLLLGLERTKILFDLLDEELFHFESPGASSEFVPNMAEYAVRQHAFSFFEHAGDIMNILMILLLCCPDSKILQKMTEKEFISLMQQVIDSSLLKAKSNKGAKPSLKVTKGINWIMVDSDELVRAMGGQIPEDVLYRHRHGEEMIVHRLHDTRQPSNRRENRPVHSIYFPSDCRLFIYIPTENGSYWHQSDMQRASRIHNNNSSNLSSNCNPHGHQVQ